MTLLKKPKEAVFSEQHALYLFPPKRLVKTLRLELCHVGELTFSHQITQILQLHAGLLF